MNCGFVVLLFCCFVALLIVFAKEKNCQPNNQTTKQPDNKTTRQQNHQTTKPHHFLSNSKEDGSFCHLPFFANFMVEPDFCLRE